MKQPSLIIVAASLVVAFGLPAAAQAEDKAVMTSSPGQATIAQKRRITATVEAIDVAKREVTLKGPKGKVVPLSVSPDVRNLEQVKVGDRVRLSYRIGVAVALVKGGDGIRERVETDAAAVAQKGARPGGVAVNRTTIVANVFSLNRKKNIVTLRGVSGQLVDVHVRDPKALQDVKVGDQVVANITESVALRVTPAPAK